MKEPMWSCCAQFDQPHTMPLTAVVVSCSLLLTAQLEAGQQACIFPLSGLASSKVPPGLPSLRTAQEAGTIRLKEVATNGSAPPGPAGNSDETKRRDWLNLLLRESLGLFWPLRATKNVQLMGTPALRLKTFSRPQIHHVRTNSRSTIRGADAPVFRILHNSIKICGEWAC